MSSTFFGCNPIMIPNNNHHLRACEAKLKKWFVSKLLCCQKPSRNAFLSLFFLNFKFYFFYCAIPLWKINNIAIFTVFKLLYTKMKYGNANMGHSCLLLFIISGVFIFCTANCFESVLQSHAWICAWILCLKMKQTLSLVSVIFF